MPPPSEIHRSATVGFQQADAYDAHRPSYPAEAVQKLLSHLGAVGQRGVRIVDLAAGTGKLTELLAAREEQYRVAAVEPHQTMRSILEAKQLRGVVVREGTAEAMEIDDGWADAVVVAQAFHWFANMDALREIHRVLTPGGKLAMIWNAENYNKPVSWPAETRWEQALNELIADVASDGQPRFRDDEWRNIFDRQPPPPLFSTPIGEDRTTWTVWLDEQGLWQRVNTISHITMLRREAKAAFKKRFEEIVRAGDGRVNNKGEMEIHGVTAFAWTEKR